MSDEKSHRAVVRLARGFEFVAEFPDTPGAPSILFDEPEPIGGGRAPSAAAVLGAAVGNCLAASLTFCLRRAHFDVKEMTAEVVTHITKNDKGRYRVREIDVDLQPSLGGTPDDLGRCGDIFEDFCIVTASVQHGIPVKVRLKESQTPTR